ncbi:uncharacterized protein LOC125018776 isoform X1 [Mugil cephalus]|uniref:uncharacterized protein LOC125018776 isoform X1 n=1 Tax=Mugil cephalus TaxID=48193 RepID=UPI001FB6FCC5|nr:uncharacterized protein LOC125018776 isoform X1 [Mugil cephalus]
MKVCLICFIFLTLQDGNTGLVNGRIYTGKEGGNITVGCSFTFSGSRRLFCRNKCEEGNILIDTTEDKAQRDRYSIEYINTGVLSNTMYVSITQLKKSDSGWYRCSLDRSFSPESSEDFEITVTEASTAPQPTSTLGHFLTTMYLSSSLTTTTTQTLLSTASSSSSEATKLQETSPAGFLLVVVVCVPVVVIVLLLPVVLLLIYRKKREDCVCWKRRRNSDHNRTEVAVYENCSPVSACEDSTYQSLNPGSRDQDQTYSTLTETQLK